MTTPARPTEKHGVRRLALTIAAISALALVAAACGDSSGASEGPASIAIAAPTDGDTVGGQFTVTLDPSVPIGEPDTGRHHVHLYYDGDRSTNAAEYDIAYDTSFTVTRLGPGEHTIEAVVANADHSLTDAHAEIDVTVSSSDADAPTATTTPTPYDY